MWYPVCSYWKKGAQVVYHDFWGPGLLRDLLQDHNSFPVPDSNSFPVTRGTSATMPGGQVVTILTQKSRARE